MRLAKGRLGRRLARGGGVDLGSEVGDLPIALACVENCRTRADHARVGLGKLRASLSDLLRPRTVKTRQVSLVGVGKSGFRLVDLRLELARFELGNDLAKLDLVTLVHFA